MAAVVAPLVHTNRTVAIRKQARNVERAPVAIQLACADACAARIIIVANRTSVAVVGSIVVHGTLAAICGCIPEVAARARASTRASVPGHIAFFCVSCAIELVCADSVAMRWIFVAFGAPKAIICHVVVDGTAFAPFTCPVMFA